MLKKNVPLIGTGSLLVLIVLIYWNTFDNTFVNMDDLDAIVHNRYIRSLSWQNIKDIFTPGVAGAYQPVRTLSYAVDYHFWRLNPVGYHLTNILCHAVNAMLVFLIVRLLAQNLLVAGITATVFAVHPVQVEAVTWMSGRRDVLFACFVLLALYGFLRFVQATHRSSKIRWYLLVLVAGGLGLLAKATAMVLPVLVVWYEVCFLLPHNETWRQRGIAFLRRIPIYLPFFLLTVGCMTFFFRVAQEAGVAIDTYHGGSFGTTFLTMIRVFADYLRMLLVPGKLSLTYGIRTVNSIFEPSFLLSLIILLCVAGLAIWAWEHSKLVCFGVVWFFIALGPVSNLLIPIGVVKADRYLYLPSIGFWLVVACGLAQGWTVLQRFSGSKCRQVVYAIGFWAIVSLMAITYAFLTIQRNDDWQNGETLWAATLETHPDSPIALNNLGRIYAERGQYEQALALYGKLIDYHPNQHHIEQVYANMAAAYEGQGLLDEAQEYYNQALDANSDYLDGYLGLARIVTELGEYDKAAEICQVALVLHPKSESIYNQLGNIAFIKKNAAEAIASYQQAISLNPYYIPAYNGLGLSYLQNGEQNRALEVFQQALQIAPDAALIRNSLGTWYMEQGDADKAIAEFQQSVQSDPYNGEVRNNLGFLLLQKQRYEEALRQLMEAVRLQPENPMVISNLGLAYAHIGLYEQAIQMCRDALQRDPTLFRTYVLLGDVCLRTNDTNCAIEAYQKALELQPERADLQERLMRAQQFQPAQP